MRLKTILPLILAGALAGQAAPALAGPSLLLDAATGHVIESDDAFAPWYPASLTKLMTTYVAFSMVRAGEVTLQSPVVMTKRAAKEPPSKMGYQPGSVLTLDNALKILMVKSANDVAAAVGESLGGSQAGFAARMNAESAKLGMTGTRWVNAHGLHDDGQVTTARDLAILASALRREFPQYAGFFSLEGLKAGKAAMPSHNTLIGRFEGADGMKTGYTCPSGFNLIASATRNGRTLMAVVVGSKTVAERAEAAAGLLERGFAMNTLGAPRLADLRPSGREAAAPVNMYGQICSKEARAAAQKAAQAAAKQAAAQKKLAAAAGPQDEDDAAAAVSSYLSPLARPRTLVPVALGGADGPVPKALALALAADEGGADVPLPSWRPDMPPPAGAEPLLVQGDSSATR